ncbi:MAG: MFS transporter [Myxococcaceae bacterium]
MVLDLLGFGIVIPQLGVYGTVFHGSPFVVGLLLSVYSLMQFLFAPVLGRLSDRYGRRPVLLYSLTGSVVGYLLFGVAGSLPMLFVSRVIAGIAGGNISTAQAYVADVTTPENRAKGMGLIGAAFGIGFVLGPAVGGVLGLHGGNRAIGLVAGGLALVNLVLAFFIVPESRHAGSLPAESRSLSGAFARLRLPVVGPVLVLMLIYTFAFSLMEGTFSVYVLTRHLAQHLGVSVSSSLFHLSTDADPMYAREASLKVGYLFLVVGLVSALIQGGLIGRLKARFGETALAVAGMVATALGLGLIPLAPTYGWLFVPAALMAAGSALASPSLSALASVHAPKDRQGEVLGAYQSMGSLGRILGPAAGGFLFTVFTPAAPYFVAAALVTLGALLALRLWASVRERAFIGRVSP